MYLSVLHAGSSECGLETTGFDTLTQAQNYLKSINKKLRTLKSENFACQPDAETATRKLLKKFLPTFRTSRM